MATVQVVAPGARAVRLTAPPVVRRSAPGDGAGPGWITALAPDGHRYRRRNFLKREGLKQARKNAKKARLDENFHAQRTRRTQKFSL
jgi:hypothetical protein